MIEDSSQMRNKNLTLHLSLNDKHQWFKCQQCSLSTSALTTEVWTKLSNKEWVNHDIVNHDIAFYLLHKFSLFGYGCHSLSTWKGQTFKI